jgi:hypothetical protein
VKWRRCSSSWRCCWGPVAAPAAKDKVSAEEAEQAKREHAEAEATMKRLEGLDPEDESFEAELRRLMREIRTHVAKDEGEMFARTPASPTIPENVKPRVRWPASSTGSATRPAGAERPTDRPVPQVYVRAAHLLRAANPAFRLSPFSRPGAGYQSPPSRCGRRNRRTASVGLQGPP